MALIEWFVQRSVLQNSRGMTFLGLDWANRSADAMECARCGLVQTFAVSPLQVVEKS